MRRDLPAPVSPVMAVSPVWRVRSARVMRAMFSTVRDWIMGVPLFVDRMSTIVYTSFARECKGDLRNYSVSVKICLHELRSCFNMLSR